MIKTYFKAPIIWGSIFAVFMFMLDKRVIKMNHSLGNGIAFLFLALFTVATLHSIYRLLLDKGLLSKANILMNDKVASSMQERKDASLTIYQEQLMRNRELFDRGVLSEDEYHAVENRIKAKLI